MMEDLASMNEQRVEEVIIRVAVWATGKAELAIYLPIILQGDQTPIPGMMASPGLHHPP